MTTNLRQHRQKLSLSPSLVAAELGVHPNSVTRWERRDRLPGPRHIQDLARTLGLGTPEVAGFFDDARGRTGGQSSGVTGLRGHGLRRLRHAAGVSVRRIGHAVGVPAATVYNWEAGRARVPIDHVPALAEVLSLEVATLRDLLTRSPAVVAAPPVGPSDSTLRRMRRRSGLTQTMVAERVGVSRHTVGKWERGHRPPLHAVRRLASTYGVPASAVARAAGVKAPRLLDEREWRRGDLPAVLRTLRHWSGLTQRQVAERCGCSTEAVRAWESGRGTPRAAGRRRLEELYRLSPGALALLCP
jgi:transcriptional regulator with XRE-family HTH domain